MGFFSAVKRFFGQKAEPGEQQAVEASTAQQATEVTQAQPEQEAQASQLAAGAEKGHEPAQVEETAAQEVPHQEMPDDAGGELETGEPVADTQEEPQDWVSWQLADLGQGGEAASAPINAKKSEKTGEAAENRGIAEDSPGQPAEETAREELKTTEAAATENVGPASEDGADAELILRLRQAEPRLSGWLGIVLEGQEEVNGEFWNRLRFLLRSLEAPEAEIEAFIADFATWLERMEYQWVDEFRSELQYRLALALDLEDEEDERNRLLVKLSQGLTATREQLGRKLDALFSAHGELTEEFWEELEELFIVSDMGYDTAIAIVERLKARAAKNGVREAAQIRNLLQEELEEIFRMEPRIKAVNKPEVVLMMGVNGAGKTTTIAKLAYREKLNGKKVLVAAADTFRAAAIEQLEVWAKRAGVDFYSRAQGADPASVAWEAMDYALKNDIDVIFVDTAGRLQTRVNLMEELGKIRQVLGKKHPGAPHRSMLVLDATTGQNALSQARLFREAAGADEIVLTKLDGTAKGGVAIAVAMQEHLPITFIGLGEKMEDLRPFNGRDFAHALLAEHGEGNARGSGDNHLINA